MKKNFMTCVSFLSIMSLFSCSPEKEINRWGAKLTQYVVEEYMELERSRILEIRRCTL